MKFQVILLLLVSASALGSPLDRLALTLEEYTADFYIDESSDMNFTAEQLAILTSDPESFVVKRQAVQAIKTWGYSAIPWNFDPAFNKSEYEKIRAGFNFWEKNSCVRFAENGEGKDRILVTTVGSGTCNSKVGRIKGTQALNMGSICPSSSVCHELAHTLGITHMQNREDRANYVDIDFSNIQDTKKQNYILATPADGYRLLDQPYEFGSTMLYDAMDTAIDKTKPVIVAKPGYEAFQNSMKGHGPTFLDVMLVNKLYNCYTKCDKPNVCQNGGVAHPNDCSKCACPLGWTGASCTERPSGTILLKADSSLQSYKAALSNKVRLFDQGLEYYKQHVVIEAPKGKKIELTASPTTTFPTDSNCRYGGVEVKFLADQRFAGATICTKPLSLVSQAETIFFEIYTYGAPITVSLTYRAVVKGPILQNELVFQ